MTTKSTNDEDFKEVLSLGFSQEIENGENTKILSDNVIRISVDGVEADSGGNVEMQNTADQQKETRVENTPKP